MIAALVALAVASGTPWVLAVGVNRPADSSVAPLHFADDDAIAAARLFPAPQDHVFLHTVPDEDTAHQHPAWAAHARVPTRAALFDSVERIARGLSDEARAGGEPVLIVWLVGHGTLDATGDGGFAMLDGTLSSRALRERVLAPLSASAHRVHLVVDTCNAAALVRARAITSVVSPGEAGAGFASMDRLAFANVGAVLASAQGQQTFEWDAMRSGIFSSLVRSAMRGLADADGNGAVSYAEMAAFGASAVESISDPRARPRMDIRAPSVDVNAPLAQRDWHGLLAPLRVNAGGWGRFSVEDDAGIVWATGNLERGFEPELWLALAPDHVVVTDSGRFRTTARDGTIALSPEENSAQSRGTIGEALKRGLLTSPFGPSYVRGFSAALSSAPATEEPAPRSASTGRRLWLVAVPPVLVVGILAVGVAVVGTGLFTLGMWSGTRPEQYEKTAWLTLAGGAAGGGVALLSLVVATASIAAAIAIGLIAAR